MALETDRSNERQEQESLDIFYKYISLGKQRAADETRPYQVDIELTRPVLWLMQILPG